ncbi:hypothetical protein [Sutcliffiella rhizosphaerae]|uniref:Uncharacterized protein n=1 Tax=Sutcliffiella rhizosphaerae TaxID=2880967 RepID=A0ABM8YKI4_9BACI|nr:hypothetical protein [Sutcliffiella rhizosphaerae]CAG9620373.1 hypothetical protein BACCIP111883_01141 [Sutcliffiella rhizosphaerae]
MLEIITIVAICIISYYTSKFLVKLISRKITFQKGDGPISNNYFLAFGVPIVTFIVADIAKNYFSVDYNLLESTAIIVLILTIFYGILFLIFERKSKEFAFSLLLGSVYLLISGAVLLIAY